MKYHKLTFNMLPDGANVVLDTWQSQSSSGKSGKNKKKKQHEPTSNGSAKVSVNGGAPPTTNGTVYNGAQFIAKVSPSAGPVSLDNYGVAAQPKSTPLLVDPVEARPPRMQTKPAPIVSNANGYGNHHTDAVTRQSVSSDIDNGDINAKRKGAFIFIIIYTYMCTCSNCKRDKGFVASRFRC
jgi:hypothetical protein